MTLKERCIAVVTRRLQDVDHNKDDIVAEWDYADEAETLINRMTHVGLLELIDEANALEGGPE